MGAHLHRFSKKLYFHRAFHKGPAKGAHGLVAYKQDGTLRPPQIMLQVVPDPARLTHTGCGNDDLGFLIKIDGFGLIAGNGKPKPGKLIGLTPEFTRARVSSSKHSYIFFIEDSRGLDSQRTVHIDLEAAMALYQSLAFNLP